MEARVRPLSRRDRSVCRPAGAKASGPDAGVSPWDEGQFSAAPWLANPRENPASPLAPVPRRYVVKVTRWRSRARLSSGEVLPQLANHGVISDAFVVGRTAKDRRISGLKAHLALGRGRPEPDNAHLGTALSGGEVFVPSLDDSLTC